jgi:RHS repeat-associated protein
MDSIYAISVMPLKSPKKLSILKPIGLFALSWVILAATAVAQISGPTTPPVGVSTTYTFDNGINYVFSNWAITNGTVNSSSSSGTTYTANVTWIAPGSGTIQFRNKKAVIATLNVTVCSAPVQPVVTFSYASRCPQANGEGAIISYSGTVPSGETWYWQSSTDGPTGTNTTLGSGSTLVTTNNSFGTFYLRPFSSCGWGTAVATADIPARAGFATGGSGCSGASYTLSAVNSYGFAQGFRWYDACVGGNALQSSSVPAFSTGTFTTPVLTATTNYYLAVYNLSTGVESGRLGITATILTTPGAMVGAASPSVFCGSGGITTLTATGAGPNDFYQWYTVPTGGTAIPDANPLTQTVNATTTFYVAGKNINTQCEGQRTAVTVTVNTVPTAPNVSTQRQCTQAGVYATATPGANADGIKWYDAATGLGLVGTGANSPIAATTVTYYASSYNSITGCESTTRTAFSIDVLNSPSAASATICGGATIPATPGLGASRVRWYNVPTGGTALITGLNSPVTTTTTIYYITSYNNVSGCESPLPRVPVTVTVVPLPTITGNAPINFTYGSSTTINVTLSTSPYYSYQWKRDGVNAGNNQTLPTDLIGSYTVATKTSSTSVECTSLPISVTNTLTGQPTPINYVSNTRIMKEGVTSSTSLYSLAQKDLVQTLAYQDGMGRTFQTVGLGQSAEQTDLVSPIAYGRQGMVDSTFLPYATATRDGRLRLNAIRGGANFQYSLSEQKAFYQNTPLVATDANPYARSIHRASMDARTIEQSAPGTDWQPRARRVRDSIVLNAATYPVRYWKADGTTSGNYQDNTIAVRIATDENGNQVRTYTNQQGQTVLKQVQLDETISGSTVNWLNTYYIYDEFGRLKYQVPPKAVALMGANVNYNVANNAATNRQVYKYVYDSIGRVVEKIEPGSDVKYIVYDKLGRVALTQDSVLRVSKQWIYTKYDRYNRPVYSGVYTNTQKVSRKAMQGLVIADTKPYFESPANNATYRGYTNTAFPTTNAPSGAITVLTASYYDGYDFDQNGTADFTYQPGHIVADANSNTVLPATASTASAVRNLPTGNGKLVIGTTIWIRNAAFYDQYDRTLQTQGFNHLNSTTPSVGSVVYADRAGHVEKTKQTHNGPSGSTVAIQQRYGYDANWRTKAIYHSINGAANETQVANYTYNILGQLVDKKLHVVAGTPLQSVDLRYNIRGWVKSINNAQLSNDSGTTNDDTNDYFGMELHYNTTEAGLGNSAYYNGNLSAATWKLTGTGQVLEGTDGRVGYKYGYDKSDKLKKSSYALHDTGTAWNKQVGVQNETIAYDHNGNILTLMRTQNQRGLVFVNYIPSITSAAQTVDNLTYSYFSNTNRLKKVEDAMATTVGTGDFKNGSTAATEYTYNGNGSMAKDLNKGISGITYNILGKPAVVTYSGTPAKTVTYTYDASGVKIKAVTLANSVTTTTDYIGGFVYTNNVLSFFSSPEGRVVKNGSNYEYQYAIADHQGNTRVVFSSATPAPLALNATFEGTGGDNSNQFSNVQNIQNKPFANVTPLGTMVVAMNQNYKVGPAKRLNVYPGDKVDMQVSGSYDPVAGFGSNNTLAAMIANVASTFGGVSGGGGESGLIYNGVNSAMSLFGLGANQGNSAPAAFLNYILFDQQYRVLNMGWEVVPASATTAGQMISIPTVNVKEAGVLFVYLSYENLSNNWAYFDDFKVTHTKTNLLQYNEYYAFQNLTQNSWTRENSTVNNFVGNGGTELNTTTQVYDLHYRNYDPVLGRMNQVDPMASKYGSVTPYNYAFNAPTNMNDPLGDDPPGTKPTKPVNAQTSGGCSWCWPQDSNAPGGGYQGSQLFSRSQAFFTPGWQPGMGSLSAGAFAAMDTRYNESRQQDRENRNRQNFWKDFWVMWELGGSGDILLREVTITESYTNQNWLQERIDEAWNGNPQGNGPTLGFDNTPNSLYTINAALGFAGVGVAYQGDFWKTNELYHLQKNGKVRFRTDKLWNNNFVKQSRLGSLKATSGLRTASNYLAVASLALTVTNVAINSQVNPSDLLNATMAGISFTGVGSLVAGAYFLVDFGFDVKTGQGLGERLDAYVGQPVVDW